MTTTVRGTILFTSEAPRPRLLPHHRAIDECLSVGSQKEPPHLPNKAGGSFCQTPEENIPLVSVGDRLSDRRR